MREISAIGEVVVVLVDDDDDCCCCCGGGGGGGGVEAVMTVLLPLFVDGTAVGVMEEEEEGVIFVFVFVFVPLALVVDPVSLLASSSCAK